MILKLIVRYNVYKYKRKKILRENLYRFFLKLNVKNMFVVYNDFDIVNVNIEWNKNIYSKGVVILS